MLIDSDILIWFFRGNENAKKLLFAFDGFSISAVNYIELLQGATNKNEIRLIRKFLTASNVEVIPINEEISNKAMIFVEEYSLSHHLMLADALIAATANHFGEILHTGNYAHYKMIPNLELGFHSVNVIDDINCSESFLCFMRGAHKTIGKHIERSRLG